MIVVVYNSTEGRPQAMSSQTLHGGEDDTVMVTVSRQRCWRHRHEGHAHSSKGACHPPRQYWPGAHRACRLAVRLGGAGTAEEASR